MKRLLNSPQVLPVATFGIPVCQLHQLCPGNESHAEGNFLNTAYFLALPFFYNPNKLTGITQGIKSSGIKPGSAPIHYTYLQFPLL
jgi:hypothetical protein